MRLGLLVAVTVAMAVTLRVLRSEEEAVTTEASPTDESQEARANLDRVVLLDTPRDSIRTITVHSGAETVVLARDQDGRLTPRYPHDVAFDRRRVEFFVASAARLTSRRALEGERSAYGLDDPRAAVTVERTDGTLQRLAIGDRTPARDAYYVTRPGSAAVYVVPEATVAPLLSTIDQLRARTMPRIAPERLQRIVVQTPSGRVVRAEYLEEARRRPEFSLTTFAVTQPFSRPLPAHTPWIEESTTQLNALRIARFVNDAPTDLARYSLAPPAGRIIAEDDLTRLDLVIGSETEDGHYAMFADSTSVFVVAGAESILGTTPDAAVSPFVLIVNIDLVEEFEVRVGGERFIGRIERTPGATGVEARERYLLNGVEIEEDLFRDLYQRAIGLQFDAEIDLTQAPAATGEIAKREPDARIDYRLTDEVGTLTVSFVPLDANFAAVVRDGVSEFIIARAKLDRMLTAFDRQTATRIAEP